MGDKISDLTRRVLEQVTDLQIVVVQNDRFSIGIDMQAAADNDVRIIDASNTASFNPVASGTWR